ncbi:hypothetical protein QFC21_006508 [Naganishia friedmannii]|uniref:Uncharacterized protein n=1 Tax=Naganishia friedmannii TaxID=89922 RepID=A0ACC2V3H1_9TREE|nr:hypothetical protein QFC21_006508 [Naganishia friedmannii]
MAQQMSSIPPPYPPSTFPPPLRHRVSETVKRFWDLGFTAFGGAYRAVSVGSALQGRHKEMPVALAKDAVTTRRFVEKHKWVDTTTFADLFALGNALPGPGSTQLAFSIATVHGGILCGLIAFLFWSIPGAAGMAALAAGVRSFPDKLPPIVLALLTGLNASAVGLIALAAYQLSLGAVTDGTSRLVLVTSASFGICYHAPWMYPVLVASGGIVTLLYDNRRRLLSPFQRRRRRHSPRQASNPNVIAATPTTPLPSSNVENGGAGEAIQLTVLPLLSAAQEHNPLNGPSLPPLAKTRSNTSTSIRFDAGGKDDTGVALSFEAKRENGDASSMVDRYSPPLAATTTPTLAEQGLRHRHTAQPDNRHGNTDDDDDDDDDAADRLRDPASARPPHEDERLRTTLMVPSKRWAYSLGAAFVLSIITLVVLRAEYPHPRDQQGAAAPRALDFFVNMVVAGVIIFGGGPVVVPLLRQYTVENVYLGVLSLPQSPALGALLGWLGIFAPGLVLKLALLPLYDSWRRVEAVKSLLRGLNAAATGLVYTAVWQLFLGSFPLARFPSLVPSAHAALVASQWVTYINLRPARHHLLRQ